MRLHHLALRTRDLPRLEAFYAGLLALPAVRRGERSVWLDAAGTIVMLEIADEGEVLASPTLELVCFAISPGERAGWEERLRRAGIAIEATTGFTMYFRDPDGRRVALSHYPDPPNFPA